MTWVSIWSSWCHCHPKTPTSLASFKSTLVLPSWYRLTQVILEKRPKNRCSTVVVVVHFIASRNFKAKSTANRHLLTTAVESIAVAALPVPHRPACVQQTSPANSTSAVISHPAADASAYPAGTTTNNLFIYTSTKFIKNNQKILYFWRFDLYQRPSSEEAGTRSSSSGSWRD